MIRFPRTASKHVVWGFLFLVPYVLLPDQHFKGFWPLALPIPSQGKQTNLASEVLRLLLTCYLAVPGAKVGPSTLPIRFMCLACTTLLAH